MHRPSDVAEDARDLVVLAGIYVRMSGITCRVDDRAADAEVSLMVLPIEGDPFRLQVGGYRVAYISMPYEMYQATADAMSIRAMIASWSCLASSSAFSLNPISVSINF